MSEARRAERTQCTASGSGRADYPARNRRFRAYGTPLVERTDPASEARRAERATYAARAHGQSHRPSARRNCPRIAHAWPLRGFGRLPFGKKIPPMQPGGLDLGCLRQKKYPLWAHFQEKGDKNVSFFSRFVTKLHISIDFSKPTYHQKMSRNATFLAKIGHF